MIFQIEKNEQGFYWHALAANNRKLAWSGEYYHNKTDCEHAIGLVKRDAPSAQIIDNTRPSSSW